MPQVIKDYTHSVQKHFLPFTEDMNRNAVKLYFRLHSTHWVRSALAGTGVEYAGMQVHRANGRSKRGGKNSDERKYGGGGKQPGHGGGRVWRGLHTNWGRTRGCGPF